MPERLEPANDQPEEQETIKILQINLNKSETAHLDIINENNLSKEFDIILIQEPHATKFNAIRSPPNFRPVFPVNRLTDDARIRSVIWVNMKLDTKNWTTIDVPGSNDITAIQLKGTYGKLVIFNIYNDCTHQRNEEILCNYIESHTNELSRDANHHMLWAGDFNRHHPLWDRDEDVHLFHNGANRLVEGLISMLADFNMLMPLPKGIPTLQHMRSKRYSRPDNVFCSQGLRDQISICEVDASKRPTLTDHFPIVTHITLPQELVEDAPSFNFREADWDKFRDALRVKLSNSPDKPTINNQEQLNMATDHLVQALQETVYEIVK